MWKTSWWLRIFLSALLGGLLAAGILVACGGTNQSATPTVVIAQDGPIPTSEDLMSFSTFTGYVTGGLMRVVDRKGDAVCWIVRDRTTSSDGGVGVSISCLPIQQLRGNYDK